MNRSLFIVSLLLTAPSLSAQAGHSYTGVHEHLDVTGLNGSGDYLNHNRITGAGDVNGDGVDDFLVGVPGSDAGKGKASLYSGVRGVDTPYYSVLWTETGSRGYGGSPADGFGSGLCALGDINADGYDDFAVSSGTGRYVMIYLGPEGSLLQALVTHDTSASDDFGNALTAVDLNHDGIKELVIGDPNWQAIGSTEKGMIQVYQFTPLSSLASTSGDEGSEPTATVVSILRFVNPISPGELSSPDMDINLVAEFAGRNENWFGSSLSGVTSGTGSDYLLVGSPRMEASLSGAVAGGEVFLFRDNPATTELDLEIILTIQDTHFSTEPGKFGVSVASVGDIVGNDGIDEFVIGAPQTDLAQTNCGFAQVFDVDGNSILILPGTVADEGFGATVAALGDIDGDTIPDMLISAPGISTGPGYVAMISGADGSTIDSLAGIETSARFGDSIATSGDVDGDGSRDIIVSRKSDTNNASSVHVFRPLHSLPYRISVDATGTGTNFAPIHGVTHGPIHYAGWTKWIGTDEPYLTNTSADYSAQYEAANIPNARIQDEGVGDLNYLWLLDQSIVDDMSRDYDVSDEEITNLANYDFIQMDNRMNASEAIPTLESIWRIGHDKAEIPNDTEWYAGFREPPNSPDGLAKVSAQIIKHYNEGWGGREVPAQKLRLIELWNEPYINYWTGNGTEFGELHVAMLKALDENFDNNGDGKADDLLMMTPIPPGDPDGWTTDFLNVLESNWDPQNPHKIRVDATVQHWYTLTPHQFLKKFEGMDDFFREIGESHNVLKQGENQEVVYPELWVTEWNRTIEQYADTFASMPFVMNAFYYMNGLYHHEFKRTDGKDFAITLAGANFFSAKLMLWKKFVDPFDGQIYIMKNHAGLAWEVYGNTLFETAKERLATVGSFYEPQMNWGAVVDNPIKDFTVMAGRSDTENRVVLVISSMQLVDDLHNPDARDEMQRLPYVVDVNDLGFTPVTITRYVQQTDSIEYKAGMEAALDAVPVLGSPYLPYSAWGLTVDGTTVSIDVDDMIQNTYEVIVIEG